MNENNPPTRNIDLPDTYAGPQRDTNSTTGRAERVSDTDSLELDERARASTRSSSVEYEDTITPDDLSPETLYDLSGTRSERERGSDGAVDEQLHTVDETEIGAGKGLDEAELARSAPLDGEPWTDQVVPGHGEKKR